MTKEYLASGDYPLLSEIIGDREPVDAISDFVEMMTGLPERPARRRPRRAPR